MMIIVPSYIIIIISLRLIVPSLSADSLDSNSTICVAIMLWSGSEGEVKCSFSIFAMTIRLQTVSFSDPIHCFLLLDNSDNMLALYFLSVVIFSTSCHFACFISD